MYVSTRADRQSAWAPPVQLIGTPLAVAYQGWSCDVSADGATLALGGPHFENSKSQAIGQTHSAQVTAAKDIDRS